MEGLPTHALSFKDKFKVFKGVLPRAFYDEIMRRTGKPKGSIIAVITGRFHSKGFIIEKALCDYAIEVLNENIKHYEDLIEVNEAYKHQIECLIDEELTYYKRSH